jgi:alkylhydroperoxidase family enzyme
VRFAVARQQGLTEEMAAQVDEGWEASSLAPRYQRTVMLADAFLGAGGPPSPDQQAALRSEFSDAELVELGIGLALFHGFSKMLIALGLEPENMDTTVLPTPGSQPR